MDDTKRLVLQVRKGKRVNLYLNTSHGLKRLGAVKRLDRERIAFEFTDDVRIVREEVDQNLETAQ